MPRKCSVCKTMSIPNDEKVCGYCEDKAPLDVKPGEVHMMQQTILVSNTKHERHTLPLDSLKRKNYPIHRGCIRYFPAALAGVANISHLGNEKHNPGSIELYHDRQKSMDHTDCILRHLIDLDELLNKYDINNLNEKETKSILVEVNSIAWRALAYSQKIHEKLGYPTAPGAKNENNQK